MQQEILSGELDQNQKINKSQKQKRKDLEEILDVDIPEDV